MMIERDCAFFNPMYMDSKCDRCKKYVGVICANERRKKICMNCHRSPTTFELLYLRIIKWLSKGGS